ncbi:anti-sigma regulatory factor (Ser/Thr protein kinase) [Streptacidiphilus sp. MAP12-20]|uniref:ATP-binding protein n=1 Tax=Streptacidiphilus sp. MAP12-20 TaxID=3156299 RepID=UPI0035121B8D
MEREAPFVEGPGVHRLVVPEGRGVVGRCRDFVREVLRGCGWLDDADDEGQAIAEDVLLMASEIVTNAALHAGGPREVVVLADGPWLRVEVLDASAAPPVLYPSVASRPGGHGLRVVQRLAAAWGSEPRAGGKAVWFEVSRPALESRP